MRKKIIVRLAGGIGNQMFSYAAAKRLALVNDADLILDNVSGFVRDKVYKRTYQLDKFDAKFKLATSQERMEPFSIIKRRMRRDVINKLRAYEDRDYIKESLIGFDERLLNFKIKKNVYIEGIWQSENYFKDVEDTIRLDFNMIKPKDLLNSQIAIQMQDTQSVMVHVRFYDERHLYNLPKSYQTTLEYYKLAFDLVKKTVSDPHFFIFSDNPKEAQKWLNLSENKVTYINHNLAENSHFDMWLMMQCKHFIIANSTFSWWGAWLAKHHNKLVIAPSLCFHNGSPEWRSMLGVLPLEWIKI